MSTQKNSVWEEELKETEVGQFIFKYKFLVFGLVAGVFVGLLSTGIYSGYKSDKHDEYGQLIFKFKESKFSKLQKNELTEKEFVSSFKDLAEKTGYYKGLVSFNLEASDYLIEKGKLNEAKEVLEFGSSKLRKEGPFINWFYSTRLAAVYEDLNLLEKAIKILEELNTSQIKIFEPKIYLDLGRLYIESGDKKKAEMNLNYVIENFQDSDFSKVAKLYLSELK